MNNLIFVDCEASGPAIGVGELTEFGAAHYPSRATFHGVLIEAEIDMENPALRIKREGKRFDAKKVFTNFDKWLWQFNNKRLIFISDNPAFDWQWINHGFHNTIGHNPFGHSARRIGDFYAGLVKNFSASSKWKKLRITKHDHNPVNDVMGNLEAFERLLNGERP